MSEGTFSHFASRFFRNEYSRTSMAQTSLGPWKSVRAMVSSSQRRLIMVRGQEANSDNLGIFFYFHHNNCMLSVLIRIASMRQF